MNQTLKNEEDSEQLRDYFNCFSTSSRTSGYKLDATMILTSVLKKIPSVQWQTGSCQWKKLIAQQNLSLFLGLCKNKTLFDNKMVKQYLNEVSTQKAQNYTMIFQVDRQGRLFCNTDPPLRNNQFVCSFSDSNSRAHNENFFFRALAV